MADSTTNKIQIIESIRQVEADFRRWVNRFIFPCISRDELFASADSIKEHFAPQLKSLVDSARRLRLLDYSVHADLIEKAQSTFLKEVNTLHGYPGSGELKPDVVKELIETLHDVAQLLEDEAESGLAGPQEEGTPIGYASEDVPTLTEDEVAVLDYLNQEHPQIRFQQDIVSACDRDRKTVSVILDKLMNCRLVSRPKGKQRGYVITTQGQRFLKEHFSA